MSSAAKSAVATVPLASSIEVLERKLVELRAEIDAILAQLASEKAARPAIGLSGTPETQAPQAIAEDEPAPAADGQPSLSSGEVDQLASATQMDAIAPDQSGAVEPSPETALGAGPPLAAQTQEATMLADGKTTAVADGRHAAAAPAGETAAPQAEMQVEPAGEAAVTPVAPAASMEPISAEATLAAAPERAADGVPASANANPDRRVETPVIDLQSRQRKQKAGFLAGTTTAPIRPRRRLATQIAASIIALLAAATAMVVADKAAVGSAPSLPWMSPLPSYMPSGANWPFLGHRQGAGQGSTTGDSRASSGRAAADDALLLRYREAWPIGS